MRLSMLGLALLVSGLAASAEASAPHLGVGTLQLGVAALEPLQLVAPCLGCRKSAPPAMLPPAVQGTPPASVRAARISNALYIGDTWRFRGGRELSLHLTPNEQHCAPLMRLTF